MSFPHNATIALFVCYPIGILINFLPHGESRHACSFFSGFLILYLAVGRHWVHHAITSLLSYSIFLSLSPRLSRVLVLLVLLVYLGFAHVNSASAQTFHFSSTQMILTQKLSSLAFNLEDGHFLTHKNQDDARSWSVQRHKHARFALAKVPNLLEYLGYTFNFSSILCGPFFEYSIYSAACNGTLVNPNGPRYGRVSFQLWPTLRPFLAGVFCLWIYDSTSLMFPISNTSEQLPYILSEHFLRLPFVKRVLYVHVAQTIQFLPLLAMFKLSEGANNTWCVGFEGFDDTASVIGWDNACNVDIYRFLTAENFRTVTKAWNKKTSCWLSRYVYSRTNGNLMATYFVSAMWHGFYPGQYLFFLSAPLVTQCERIGRRKLAPLFMKDFQSSWRLFCRFITGILLHYFTSAYFLRTLQGSVEHWKNQYFYGHVLLLLFYPFVLMFPTPKENIVAS